MTPIERVAAEAVRLEDRRHDAGQVTVSPVHRSPDRVRRAGDVLPRALT
jgi:hypothetical protein